MTSEDGDRRRQLETELKAALRRMPGPVALVTTRDPSSGAPAGLAASAVIPVTMEPPTMLVAINQRASAEAAIRAAGRYCINLLGTTHTALVGLFANSELRAQRFAGPEWAERDGLPYLPAACASLFCRTRSAEVVGTHALFVGEVEAVLSVPHDEGEPLGWVAGRFARLGPL